MCSYKNIFSLRKVNKNDKGLLFNWVNDPDVRKWSFNKKSITLDEHKVWFKQKLNDENTLIWVFEIENIHAGMVRLEKEDNEIILNYLIAPESRGRGLASKMLKMAMIELNNYWKNIKVFAYTLPDNIVSIKSLENADFSLKNSSAKKNCYLFNKEET